MKTTQRLPKAIAIVIIVGIGLLYNMRTRNIVMEPFREMTAEFKREQIKSDTVQTNENQSRLFIYTKSIINTSIQHLISSL
jgi:hypothetical protein